MRLTSLKSNSSRVRAPDPQSAADCEIDEALWAAYRRYDKSAVTKQLLRRYLTAGAAVASCSDPCGPSPWNTTQRSGATATGRWLQMKKTKIVIAGGGFAGLYAAKHFDKHLACCAGVEVTLISRENFILFHADAVSKR